MSRCACGAEIAPTATSCPRCGRTFIGKTIVIVLAFVIAGLVWFGCMASC